MTWNKFEAKFLVHMGLITLQTHYANVILFTSLCATNTCFSHFLGQFLSNGGDHGLQVITAAAVQL